MGFKHSSRGSSRHIPGRNANHNRSPSDVTHISSEDYAALFDTDEPQSCKPLSRVMAVICTAAVVAIVVYVVWF